MEEYEKATVEVVAMGTVAVIVASDKGIGQGEEPNTGEPCDVGRYELIF